MVSDSIAIVTLFQPSLISGFNLQQIGILVGAIFSISFIITIWIENQMLENKTPSIKILPFVDSGKHAKLKIFNNGAYAKFTAKFKVIKADFIDPANLYEMVWETKEEIDNKDHGVILVAQKTHTRVPNATPAISLFYKDVETGKKNTLISGYWDTNSNDIIDRTRIPNPVFLEISITSERPLRKSFGNLIFRLSQPTITDLDFDYCVCKKTKTRKLKRDREGYLS